MDTSLHQQIFGACLTKVFEIGPDTQTAQRLFRKLFGHHLSGMFAIGTPEAVACFRSPSYSEGED